MTNTRLSAGDASDINPIMSRKNHIYAEREEQLRCNQLALEGGKPYINARLWRAPNESELSWNGNRALTARGNEALQGGVYDFGMVGRRDRTTNVNDAGRVAGKIQQYLFKNPVQRDGADDDFIRNMGGRGVDALTFWMQVSEYFTAQQWVWLQASRESVAESIADRNAHNAVRWTAYPALSVPDFSISEDGEIKWVLIESKRWVNDDPFALEKEERVRTLWRKNENGRVSMTRFIDGEKGPVATLSLETNLTQLPFVLLGTPSAKPWWFDDVEQIACQMLNMDSINIDNLIRCVFPQLIISEGTYDNLQTKLTERWGADNGHAVLQVVKEIVRGADMPIVESQTESGITRYITPNTSDLTAIPNEVDRKRRLLFDITGLSLFNKESRQTQTAESKQFDQLDTESTLKNRALLMQAAEERLVAISKELDPAFAEYAPIWETSFDVVDIAGETTVIKTIGDLPDTTPTMRKMAMRAAVRILGELHGVSREMVEAANREIDAYEPDTDETGVGLIP